MDGWIDRGYFKLYFRLVLFAQVYTFRRFGQKKFFVLKIGSDKIAAKEQIRSKSHQTSLTQKRGKAKKAFTN